MSARVLVIDAHGPVEHALCASLADAGLQVVAHVAGDGEAAPPAARVVRAADPAGALDDWNDTYGPFDRIVFGQPRDTREPAPDDDPFDALAEGVDARLGAFLATLQAAAAVAMRRGDGAQIWALTQDDSVGYYLDTAPGALPIDVRARHAALKSLGKEMLRFGVRVNAAHLQPVAEAAEPEAWHAARDGLKAFALRFRPSSAEAVADALTAWIARDDLPLAGMVVPIGIGFAENNL
ncbi:hypothetical protein [Burkholderia stagnalis]|uniref:SDR family oxidoreductase n=1 Tax=Burkholderia stagnalis TaxID=1503054 RepID=A0ABX9YPQ3_9BURK|nr:hypothetical protein [Burkholderia stagnalis]KWK15449.1 hypothetical protein WT77_32195 [Burkholderia stagnalis]RQQ59940.1 hypothetical protein DF158_13370 [Burkholderia stagnalis]RQQ66259.1 hypothetical protein DF139_22470 [Burkholderia stagnalis]RQQ69187.1 hypothetical protein DF137_14695 [Burkholderia stagnalis]RQQ81573.1 hypothetical protein DF138_13055 [Burkholderia stagnalis]